MVGGNQLKLYSENENYKLYEGSMLDMLEVIEPNSIDSIITDPPYELNFMNKGWDNSGIAFQKETWEKCYEVLKPGGYLLAFGGSRTFHRIACAIEDAGFEIRDTIMWLYGSGFPKSMDISKSLDKRNGRKEEDFIKLGNYLKEKITDNDSICAKKIGFSSALVRFWKLGERIPNKETWLKLKEEYRLDNTFDWLIEREEAEREVIGEDHRGQLKDSMFFTKNIDKAKETGKAIGYGEWNITIPSTDLAKQWEGWGTALKPSFEPIIVARKPFKGSLVDNVIEYGVGVINIDECRVNYISKKDKEFHKKEIDRVLKVNTPFNNSWKNCSNLNNANPQNELGRFPANTILTYDETDFDEVCGVFPNTKTGDVKPHKNKNRNMVCYGTQPEYRTSNFIGDSGSASRYFYCAKASKKDRDEGLDEFEEEKVNDGRQTQIDNAFQRGETLRKNTHPTVKPTELMQYLVRLVSPNGATILDPFNGSGSTGKAVMYENREREANYKYIGIELTEEYLPIAKARIEYVCNLPEEPKQPTIFDFIGE